MPYKQRVYITLLHYYTFILFIGKLKINNIYIKERFANSVFFFPVAVCCLLFQILPTLLHVFFI